MAQRDIPGLLSWRKLIQSLQGRHSGTGTVHFEVGVMLYEDDGDGEALSEGVLASHVCRSSGRSGGEHVSPHVCHNYQ